MTAAGEIIRVPIAAGLNNRAIAEKLVIHAKTDKGHASSILSKLGLKDRTQPASYALQHPLSGDEP